ncbi:MAG: hypothetical protein DLM65_08075 [Candidatus Aeolococcus gillhamiae]|uniref:Uncharacterized protein n=1 Tax=Candidatus Aeolococcus gillhamiae TaxID=3127015 RepID=A0A2W6AA41_9BACT|nr:MAG: hypothetical protein DLM65_08075 [Candidatus Dormibacter sp. RRmetagenome_bin12]
MVPGTQVVLKFFQGDPPILPSRQGRFESELSRRFALSGLANDVDDSVPLAARKESDSVVLNATDAIGLADGLLKNEIAVVARVDIDLLLDHVGSGEDAQPERRDGASRKYRSFH